MSSLLVVLACAVFAQATSEFMLAGLVEEIAAEFAVPVAVAGACTSAFAAGMVIGAPVMALGARRFPPRTALTAFLVLFVAVHALGALTPQFWVLLVSRVLAALATAGFLAIALGVAVRSVPPQHAARATGVLLSGTTLALIVGVPAGALLAQLAGWRSTFWVVGGLASLALLALFAVPIPGPAAGPRPSVRGESAILRRRPVVLTLLTAVLVNAGTFAVHTYLGPLLGLTGSALVPVALAGFGVGAFAGVTVAARTADAHYHSLLLVGGPLLLIGWAALAVLADAGPAVLVLVVGLGAVSFAVGSGVIAHSLVLSREAPTLGGAVTTAALNVGATAGPLLGGVGLAAGSSAPAWIAAGLVGLALLPALAGTG